MQKTDKKQFMQTMLGVADNFRDSITEAGLDMRFKMLEKYTVQQIEKAAMEIMQSRKYTKMPTSGEFIQAIDGEQPTSDDIALLEADKVIAHLRRHGDSSFPDFKDNITRHLMTNRWRYKEWARKVDETELKWWVKEFREAYCVCKANPDSLPPQIEMSPELMQLVGGVGKRIDGEDDPGPEAPHCQEESPPPVDESSAGHPDGPNMTLAQWRAKRMADGRGLDVLQRKQLEREKEAADKSQYPKLDA